MKDYYKILGVDKSASKDEIKKAFRKMAHQYHPDKTKNDAEAGQKFKEASEAYSVLSDDSKRKQYDTFGSAGVGGNGFNGGGFNPGDFGGFDFSGFQQGANGVEFDLGDIFGDLFGGGRNRQARQPRGRDISIDIEISFEDSIFGVERDILVTKASKCLTCEGSGAAPGSAMVTCNTCNGKGKINETRRSFIGVFSTTRVCDTCHGLGQVPKEKCGTCHGDGITERQQEITVKIAPGMEDGEMVRLGGMGEAIPFGVSGDLYVKIHVKPHPQIRKEGFNLVTELGIKLTQALTGGEVMLATLDGALELKIPEGSNTGDVLRIKGKGVPNERGKRGDLLVRLNIVMPKKISRDAKRAIEELKKEGI
jgi:molecular chaperone DnaJ